MRVDDFSMLLPPVTQKRRDIQARRRRPDGEIVKLFRIPFWAVETSTDFRAMMAALIDSFRLPEIFGTSEIVLDARLAIDR